MAADQTQLKQIIHQEYTKCAMDPKYFMTKYCKIIHPMRGLVSFSLWDFQKDVVDSLTHNRYNIILKSRQLGLSTLIAGYSLWMMLFQENKKILVIATKSDVAMNLVSKVKTMHDNIPSWMRGTLTADNKKSLEFSNGSAIKATSSKPESARSEALSLLVIDEAAFVEKADEVWTAASLTLATGGNAVILSTPNGVGNFFHQMWVDAVNNQNDFSFIKLPWTVHPERDQDWRDEQDRNLGGEREAAQECDCSFITSGTTVIRGDVLQWYAETHVEDPLEKRGFDGNYWIWEYPKPAASYIVCADVARGDGSDYSAFHVIDVEDLRQVAEYKGKPSAKDFGDMLYLVGVEWSDALIVVENATYGWGAIQRLIDRDYQNLFYSSTDLQYVDVHRQISNKLNSLEKKMVPGFTTTSKTRPLMVSKLEEYFRTRDVVVRSQRLIDELFVFQWNGSKPEAVKGYNDDLVMSFAIGMWVRDTALRLRSEGINLTKTALDGIKHNTHQFSPVHSQTDKTRSQSQWNVNINGNSEDLTWLLG